jgi:hypothetical protein
MNQKMTLSILIAAFLLSGPNPTSAGGGSPRGGNGATMTKKAEMLRRIESVAKLKALTQKSLSEALGTTFEFEDASEDDDSKDVEAHGKPGAAIEAVDLRGEPGEFLVLNIAPSLSITDDDVRKHFGRELGTHGPGNHAAPDSPWYLVYWRGNEQLKFGLKPGKPNILVEVIVDRTQDALDEIKSQGSKER